MITDPKFAPRRNDLPWLRRRRKPRVAATPQEAHAAVSDFVSGRTTEHQPPPAAPSAPSPVGDFVSGRSSAHHHASSSLDLDAPSTPATPPPTPPPAPARAPARATPSSSLDLDEPAPVPARPASSASLDLDTPSTASTPAPPARRRPAGPPEFRVPSDERVRSGDRFQFTVADPTVTLNPIQSAVGTLTFEAACSDEVGELRLGCAYELTSGLSSTVQLTQGNRVGPPQSRRPVVVASHERFENIEIDLRQCLDLRRLVIYAFSERRQPLNWGGTLITTTFGGARIELPLDSLQLGDSAVLLSLYNVRGQFVLRAEMLSLYGDVRECCRTFGFDRITWLDDRTPVD